MFLPVQNKPNSTSKYSDWIYEIPNLIDSATIQELKNYALDTNLSGLHRRGSKSPLYVNASFYTCLVFPHNVNIYDMLDVAWEKYCKSKNLELLFIEPYEIKSYVQDDCFGLHNDCLIDMDGTIERKVNLILQLSDSEEYEGGDLYIGSVKCSRKIGTGIFFPANFLHSVTTITKGNRFSLIGHAWGPVNVKSVGY